jgi:hypothetical protein
VVISGTAHGGTHPFTVKSSIVLVSGGATVNITVNTPAGTFTTSEIGQEFNFQVQAYFGTSSTNLNNISQDMPTWDFTIVS